jgi:RNA polymerase sigma factor (sigma-70 family)
MSVPEVELSDRELMIRFYDCEAQAFDLLIVRWRPRLLRFFRTLGFLAEDAEDLTQNTMVKLYLTKETFSFDVSQPLAPFLYTIARNLAIARWRHEKTEPETIVDFNPFEDEDAMAHVHRERMEALPPPVPNEMMTDLSLCILDLSKTERLYLSLCERHGLGDLSHTEIAEVLGKRNLAEITRISQRTREKLRAGMVSRGYGRNLSLSAKEGKECSR